MENVDPSLLEAVEQGTYVVDPYSVADAILRRHDVLVEARRLSAMLIATELDEQAPSTQ